MPIVGVVENMKMNKANAVELATEKLGLKYLGAIPFDPQVEEAIGNSVKLLETAVGKSMPQIKKMAKPKM
jgi:MinD superfamily P-loop ATPase